jgi:hypothetical protein
MKAQPKARAPRAPRAPKVVVKQAAKLLALPLLAPIDALNNAPLNEQQLIEKQQAIALLGGLITDPIVKSVRKLNQWQTATKGYGDGWPKEGTSGRAIWEACSNLEVSMQSNTKLISSIIDGLNLSFINKAGEIKIVNSANISIEVNSYKKRLSSMA